MKALLALALFVLACCGEKPAGMSQKVWVKVVATFQYKDKKCEVVEVQKSYREIVLPSCDRVDDCPYFTVAKFIDCGDGPIPANYPQGKTGELQ